MSLDLRRLDELTDYKTLVSSCFNVEKEREGKAWCQCIWNASCHTTNDPKQEFHFDTGQTQCFKCGTRGNMITAMKHKYGTEWKAQWLSHCPEAGEVLGSSASRSVGVAVKPSSNKKTLAEQHDAAVRRMDADATTALVTAWGVTDAWTRSHRVGVVRNPSNGEVRYLFPVWKPDGSTLIGLKRRALSPVDGAPKSKESEGGKPGLFGIEDKKDGPVLIVEGEKDFAVASHDLPGHWVLGLSMGAGSWKDDWSPLLRDRDVTLALDSDAAGVSGAHKIFRSLSGTAKTVVSCTMPTAADGKHVDVFDFLRGAEARGVPRSTPEAFLALLATAKPMGKERVDVAVAIRALISEDDKPDAPTVARALYKMMVDDGALFAVADGNPICVYRGKAMVMSTADAHWASMLLDITGWDVGSNDGRRISQVMTNDCIASRDSIEASWFGVRGKALYLPTYDKAMPVVEVDAEGWRGVPNGYNDVVILPWAEGQPINLITISREDAQAAWDEVWSHLTVQPSKREYLKTVLLCMPLFGLMSTRPLLRFSGQSGSGKTSAAKLITTWLYGDVQLSRPTLASLYRTSTRRPVVVLDNIESRNLIKEEGLVDFMIMAATGITKEKSGEDRTSVISEVARTWVVTTGIEPIGGGLREVINRTISFEFERENQADAYSETSYLDRVAELRDALWAHVFYKVSDVLRDVDRREIIARQLGRDSKHRLSEFYSLITLLHGDIERVMEWMGEEQALEDAQASSDDPLIQLLMLLPRWERASVKWTNAAGYYSVTNILAQTLHAEFSRLSGEHRLFYPHSNPGAMGKRMKEAAPIFEHAGIRIIRRHTKVGASYTISVPVTIEEEGGLPF